ncbi:tripartite tricarboxylate transporter TctB family protein [Candidimonas sp. SYP-B2681]|uniref:tripartite tricarboxylate transporter TctB family protein n=1 Tax=Candidimonas sp. SYP-B2681 TaxID=2497686 RepID=UPI000F89BCE6|nr:tripartite tricarboxylate transporter TctB family protein [Candidimonas sp. SYP-B2681]RTZ41533.1 tripartite tricarboxylate transporter TctB family protein [Candidimonas sp. SYP-B2681]
MTLLRKGPWWLGLAVILMGAVCFYASTELAATAQYAAVGPGMFVAVVGLALIGLGVLLLVQIARGEVFEPEEAENAVPGQSMDKRAFFTALLAAIVPALTIETLGLPVTAMLSFMLVARAFGSKRLVFDLVVGFVLASICWFIFGWLGLQLGGFFPLAGF